jgi:hypothetical protein
MAACLAVREQGGDIPAVESEVAREAERAEATPSDEPVNRHRRQAKQGGDLLKGKKRRFTWNQCSIMHIRL